MPHDIKTNIPPEALKGMLASFAGVEAPTATVPDLEGVITHPEPKNWDPKTAMITFNGQELTVHEFQERTGCLVKDPRMTDEDWAAYCKSRGLKVMNVAPRAKEDALPATGNRKQRRAAKAKLRLVK